MDIRSIEKRQPKIEQGGNVSVWWLFEPGEMLDATDGGYLELVIEFEIKGGEKGNPHKHPTYAFYYVTQGRGVIKIGNEIKDIYPGDLIKIPPNKVHSMWPKSENASLRCFCFAIGLKGTLKKDYINN